MEDLLRTILMEVRNLSYLFFGFAVIWAVLFAYLYSLSRRTNNLQQEIERLKAERQEDQKQVSADRR
ncbi:MAG: CcmD family protein [Anaerolineae bacterium]